MKSRSTLHHSYTSNALGKAVHPDAPSGGGGRGHFVEARPSGSGASVDQTALPHPRSPAGRRLTPDDISAAAQRASPPDSLHIMFFMEDVSPSEEQYVRSIAAYAKAPPRKMRVIVNGGREKGLVNGRMEDGLATHADLQAAINDPTMRGTIVISHGSPEGKIWEKHGIAICPAGFTGSAKFPCALTLRPRFGSPRPQWVLLAGCHMGASEDAWKQTFGKPLMLDASEVYTTGGKSSISGTDDDTESTIPKLKAVFDWLKDYKSNL
jgi:hypothetical protein